MKPKLLREVREGLAMPKPKQHYAVNDKATGVVVNSRQNVGIFLQIWGDVFGILYDEELLANGKSQASYRKGDLVDVYIKKNEETRRMLTLSFEQSKLAKPRDPALSVRDALIREVAALNSKHKSTHSVGDIALCSILLKTSSALEKCPLLKQEYEKAGNQHYFLAKLKNPKCYAVVPS